MTTRTCNLCPDNPKRTKIVYNNKTYTLDEFEDFINSDPRIRRKFEEIDKELERY